MAQSPMLAVPSRTVAPTPDATVTLLDARGGYLWQPKWDGIRAFAHVADGTARLVSRLGVDLTSRYPEVVAALSDAYLMASQPITFDGELLVFHDGRPEFARVHQRNAQGNARRIYHLAKDQPATLMAFDLLDADGADFRSTPLSDRLAALTELVPADNSQVMVSPTGTDGALLWKLVTDQHLEGVVAKLARSRYTNRRDPAWVKIKATRRLFALVSGWEPGKGSRTDQVGALCLCLLDPAGHLIPVGQVGSGIKEADHAPLLALLASGTPFVVEVEYQEASLNRQLRFPVLKAFGQLADLATCTLSQLP